MKTKYIIGLILFSLININCIYGDEIKYNFCNGAVYYYKYTRQDSSSVNAPVIGTKNISDSNSIDFQIKSVGFQDNAFILDIGNEQSTFRRYLLPNGDLKGSPAEDRDIFPFFIKFPESDWRIGSSIQDKDEIKAFGKDYPVIWNIKLEKVDNIRNLADIVFETKFKINDDRLFSKTMSLNGKIVFNMSEGVIHQADWNSIYTAKQICKELAITRNLWSFTKQTSHRLIMTGVDK